MSAGADHSDDDIALAGEYVLRVLSDTDHRAFEARLAEEPSLRRLVAEWEEQLAGLADEIEEIPPPPHIKRQIEDRLFPAPRRRRFGRRFWGSAAVGLVALGAVAFVLPDLLTPSEPSFVAEIAAEDASLIVSARLSAQTNTLKVTRTAGAARPGRTLELWLIADGAAAPVSLGLIEAPEVSLPLPKELALAFEGGVLAISDEPPGGSPTGAPTGDVLALGVISEG